MSRLRDGIREGSRWSTGSRCAPRREEIPSGVPDSAFIGGCSAPRPPHRMQDWQSAKCCLNRRGRRGQDIMCWHAHSPFEGLREARPRISIVRESISCVQPAFL